MNYRWLLLGVVFLAASPLRAISAVPDDRLTAAEIMRRSAAAQNINSSTSLPEARLGTITEDGHTWSELVVVKPPDKLLIRDIYPWMHLTVYRGFDGKRAWTSSSFGGGGLVDADSEKLIKSTTAWYTSSEMIPGRWPVKLVRLADQMIDGKAYFTIRVFPLGGDSSTFWIDKSNYSSRAVSSRPDRYLKCEHPQLHGICRHEDVISGGKSVGSIDIVPVRMNIDDSQFEMPEMSDDRTTQWILDRYGRALGPHDRGTITLRGSMQEVVEGVAPSFATQWSLQTTSPLAFENTQVYHGRRAWRLTFDGNTGTIERFGTIVPATYASAVLGMAYNKCELNATECGVRVTRLANVGLDGRWYYALGVTAIRTPSLWYVVLIDPATDLPFALWLRYQLLYLEDYAKDGSGESIPATWTFQSTTNTFKVTHVQAVTSTPR